jgi:hypothetical protein
MTTGKSSASYAAFIAECDALGEECSGWSECHEEMDALVGQVVMTVEALQQ